MNIYRVLGPDTLRFAGKTVLLTGGNGFLGRHFLALFREMNTILKHPVRVISVDNYISSARRERPWDLNIQEMWADVSQPLNIKEPIHFIISAAGIASPTHYRRYPLECIDCTVSGTRQMLDLARRNIEVLEGMLVFSSSEIYGDPSVVPTPETYLGYVSSTGERSCYDESKRMAETLSVIYYKQYGVPVKIVRPFNVYGPGMLPNDKRVVPMFAYQALNSEPLTVFQDGRQTRTFCDITDAMDGFMRVLLHGGKGEVYNIGNDDPEVTIGELAEMMNSIVPCTIQEMPYPDTYPGSEPMRRCPDLSKARKWLKYEPTVSLVDGLEMFLQWAERTPEYWPDGHYPSLVAA